MIRYSTLDRRQRRVYDACHDGWYMGGRYTAKFDNHARTFTADSVGSLYREVERWFQTHEEHHGNARMLVKCAQVL